MNIAETIRETCKTAGLSQQQFASKYDIPLRTLETWLGGTRKPPKYVVTLLLRCLSVDFPKEPVQDLSETQIIPTLKENPKKDDLGAIFDKIEADKEAEDAANPTDLKPFAKILGCSFDEQEPVQKKPYILCDLFGNPLSQADSEYAHQERAAGRTSKIMLSDDEDPYHTRQVFYCTANNLKFEVIKEV